MSRSASIIAIGIIAMLAVAGCSGPAAGTANDQSTPAIGQVLPPSDQGILPANEAPAAVNQVAPANDQAVPANQASSLAKQESVVPAAVLTAPATGDGNYITAQGVGQVTGTPDVVTITLGVSTTSDSAQNALGDNNTKAADVIAVLKANGVAPADLQTSQLSVNPTYDNQGQRITGYQVSNMVTAKLRDIGAAGALIDAVGKAAGDAIRVQQLNFSIDDDNALRSSARTDAVKRAATQAKQLADAAGVALGPVHSITETPTQSPVMYAAAMATDSAASPTVPIEPGSLELNLTVQVVYQIAQ